MQLISINIGLEQSIPKAKRSGKTGIYKLPVHNPVRIVSSGIPGDAICDKKNHGGPDQAVYIYGETDYQWWSQALDRELVPGTFGENLTISGLESGQVHIGDVLQIGEVSLQVTSPRMPCVTLAARMSDKGFIEQFRQAERPGLYCRVLREDLIRVGELVLIESYPGETVTILEMFRDYYLASPNEARLRRTLAAPISSRARADKEKQLRKLLAKPG